MIGKDKVRVTVTIPKEVDEELNKILQADLTITKSKLFLAGISLLFREIANKKLKAPKIPGRKSRKERWM